jgi:hypothetical protein
MNRREFIETAAGSALGVAVAGLLPKSAKAAIKQERTTTTVGGITIPVITLPDKVIRHSVRGPYIWLEFWSYSYSSASDERIRRPLELSRDYCPNRPADAIAHSVWELDREFFTQGTAHGYFFWYPGENAGTAHWIFDYQKPIRVEGLDHYKEGHHEQA